MKKTLFLPLFLMLALGLQAQVRYNIFLNYHGMALPDFTTLGEPDRTGTNSCFDLEGIPEENSDYYALLLEYDMQVKKADTYTFRLCSDDGSRLYIDGKRLLDIDSTHGPISKEVSLLLDKGTHLVKVEYFEHWKSQTLNLSYRNSSTGGFITVGENPTTSQPRFVKRQAKETARRMKAWIGKDEVVVFPLITDVHTTNRETYRHIGYIVGLDNMFHYDFMANLGDIGLNVEPAHSSAEIADMILQNTLTEMAKYKGVFLYAPGNHDYDGGAERHLSSARLCELFQQPSLQYADGNLHLTGHNCWSYYDLPEKRLRIITLNSQNSETQGDYYYTYGEAQLAWLMGLLLQTPDSTGVVILSHYMPHPVGQWPSVKSRCDPTIEGLMRMLESYVYKTSGGTAGLQWDFTGAKGQLVGLLTGDSHINSYIQLNGVNYFVSQGYGKMENTQLEPGQRRAWFNSRESLCCDIVVIKPATGEVHTFRLGAGGAAMDYLFKY
ncbi:MAG: hypothetical protein IKP89_04230 [Bacteroidales bacterium]|nr:hypothetical protein [Bacteroidales bacterium]